MKNFFGCKMVHKKFKLKKKISHKQKNCCCCCTCQHISPFEFWQVPNKSKIKEVKSLPRSTVFQNLYTRCFKNSFYFKIKSSKNSKHYLLTRLSRAVQKNKISLITKKQKNQYRATSSLYAWIHSWSNLNGDRCCLAKSGVRFLLFL